MGNGRKTEAPCGHMGEVVIGTYVQCLTCDKGTVPEHVDPELTPPMFVCCPGCGSWNTEEFLSLKSVPDWHCWDCGRVWVP